jgi:hypothetical protein
LLRKVEYSPGLHVRGVETQNEFHSLSHFWRFENGAHSGSRNADRDKRYGFVKEIAA